MENKERQIPEVYNTLTQNYMTLEEYEKYRSDFPYGESIKDIRCIECGDEIDYCNGDKKVSYFRHNSSHDDHLKCKYYSKGQLSQTPEARLRRKLVYDKNNIFNFEISYKNGKYSRYLTFPPFKKEEIEEIKLNNIKIYIKTDRDRKNDKPKVLTFEAFKPRKVNRISFNLPRKIIVTIKKKYKEIAKFNIDAFKPDEQIYASLTLQDYVNTNNGDKNTNECLNSFSIKRKQGYIYTGKHYFIFFYKYEKDEIEELFSNRDDIKLTYIPLETPLGGYYLYDVVFLKVNDFTKEFCFNRKCLLTNKNDAIILWPPILSEGNYKYYKNNYPLMWISFQNDNMNLDLKKYELQIEPYFKVKNINSEPFYVYKYEDDKTTINDNKDSKISDGKVTLNDLYKTISTDLKINKFNFENEISFHNRLIYSALSRYILEMFNDREDSESSEEIILKSHVISSAKEILNSYKLLDPNLDSYFYNKDKCIDDIINSYIELGYILSDGDYFRKPNSNKKISIGGRSLVININSSIRKTRGLGLWVRLKDNEVLPNLFSISPLNSLDYFKSIINNIEFIKYIKNDNDKIEIFNIDNYNWIIFNIDQFNDEYAILKLNEELNYYIIKKYNDELYYSSLLSNYDINRLILGLCAYLNKRAKCKITSFNTKCIKITFGNYNLPILEKSILKSMCWALNRFDDISEFITNSSMKNGIIELCNHLSLDVIEKLFL